MNILTICSANRCRSITLEALLNATPGITARSAGTHPIDTGRAITETDLRWADAIIVFEHQHIKTIRNRFWKLFRDLRIILFDIPDEFEPFDPDLLPLLVAQFQARFGLTLEIPADVDVRYQAARNWHRLPWWKTLREDAVKS
jgi:Predicted protein tyrosine phosphatase